MALKAENPTTENRPIKPIHLLVIYNGNPVAVSPNVNAVIENLKRKDLFVVGFDMVMTDSLEYCELLPSSKPMTLSAITTPGTSRSARK